MSILQNNKKIQNGSIYVSRNNETMIEMSDESKQKEEIEYQKSLKFHGQLNKQTICNFRNIMEAVIVILLLVTLTFSFKVYNDVKLTQINKLDEISTISNKFSARNLQNEYDCENGDKTLKEEYKKLIAELQDTFLTIKNSVLQLNTQVSEFRYQEYLDLQKKVNSIIVDSQKMNDTFKEIDIKFQNLESQKEDSNQVELFNDKFKYLDSKFLDVDESIRSNTVTLEERIGELFRKTSNLYDWNTELNSQILKRVLSIGHFSYDFVAAQQNNSNSLYKFKDLNLNQKYKIVSIDYPATIYINAQFDMYEDPSLLSLRFYGERRGDTDKKITVGQDPIYIPLGTQAMVNTKKVQTITITHIIYVEEPGEYAFRFQFKYSNYTMVKPYIKSFTGNVQLAYIEKD